MERRGRRFTVDLGRPPRGRKKGGRQPGLANRCRAAGTFHWGLVPWSLKIEIEMRVSSSCFGIGLGRWSVTLPFPFLYSIFPRGNANAGTVSASTGHPCASFLLCGCWEPMHLAIGHWLICRAQSSQSRSSGLSTPAVKGGECEGIARYRNAVCMQISTNAVDEIPARLLGTPAAATAVGCNRLVITANFACTFSTVD